ncbi:DUF1326 domain-containing protein [Sinomonas atrocyanea]|uniref:DUF1326 domain-containing protein n=1 Tax=Sinomonas atrocyanea TaxID=37927 RepID=UPI00278234E5|nr:DUF1326 domain-containing protein [Sinomonas atrocyanea]MDQ0261399.1 hypothetical protein [Sinomonas atrocyanea]MDR6623546.1 hypothetical protein [Sinomonas atrocyanea]
MAWKIEGTYFENCNCDMVCPCSTSGLTAPADNDRCKVALTFHIDKGDVNGVDVSGLNVCVVADSPALMDEGGWKMGVLMDAAASPEQAQALGAVFGGQLGGPMEGLAPLVGEMLGQESREIAYANNGREHSVRIADAVDITVEDFVSRFDATGAGVKVSGVGFPADTLAAGRATTSTVDVFGLSWDNTGKNSFSAPFAWSA